MTHDQQKASSPTSPIAVYSDEEYLVEVYEDGQLTMLSRT
jgi:hypothetical protein